MTDLHEIWWSHIKNSVLIDRDGFMRYAKSFDARPVYVGDELAAVVLTRGLEIHLVKLGKHRFTRSHFSEFLRPGMVTLVPAEDKASRAFVTRLGFHFTRPDIDGDYHYTLGAMAWAQKTI